MGGSYEQVGSAADVETRQLNPYADALTQQLMGTTGLQQFMAAFPQIQQMVNNMTSGYGQTRMQQAELAAQQAQSDIAGNFADIGALRSSAAMQAIGRGVTGARLGALTDIAQMQTQLAGQLGLGGLESIGSDRALLASLARPEYYVYEPTYAYKPGFGDYFASILGAGGQAAAGIGSLT
jgi:hypothetical protein